MRRFFSMIVPLIESTTLAIALYMAIAVTAAAIVAQTHPSSPLQTLAVLFTVIAPATAGACWLFRRLRAAAYSVRESRVAAVTFLALFPPSLAASIVVPQIPGGYAAFMGRPFGLIGAFLGIVTGIVALTPAPTSLALWAARRGAADIQTR